MLYLAFYVHQCFFAALVRAQFFALPDNHPVANIAEMEHLSSAMKEASLEALTPELAFMNMLKALPGRKVVVVQSRWLL